MKRFMMAFVAALAVAIPTSLAIASSRSASSTATWPATCELKTSTAARWSCVDGHLNALDARVRAQGSLLLAARTRIAQLRARNATLATCLAEYPVGRYTSYDNYYYGSDTNGDGNFDQNNYGGQAFQELDQTHSGDSVGSWFLRDTCSAAVFGRPPAP